MQDQITALGALDDEIVRTGKWFETSLGQFEDLKKEHGREFDLLSGAVSALDEKGKLLRRCKTSLLGLEGYLQAQGGTIGKLSGDGTPAVGQFFLSALERLHREVEVSVASMQSEVKLDLLLLHGTVDNFPAALSIDLKKWRSSFDERTSLVEGQSEHLCTVAKIVERTLDKAIEKLIKATVNADSRTPGNESKGPEEEGEEDQGWVPGHRTEASA